ncbi:MAG: ATP-dependent DNA helicase RecQ [Cryomorphaceae bacterium]
MIRTWSTRYLGLNEAKDILNRYWGYEEFRPLQSEIIASTMAGRDTLALLPTGGGKSICFQVPAMLMPGICLVISPLIALMKDQVANLQKRGIKALSVTSELDASGLDAIFDRCIYEKDVKFLYLSPERLQTELAKKRIAQMNVNLLAVDEAHCISEWGYDFRPSYLDIAEIRPLMGGTPVLALTASATKVVVKDIQDRLSFEKHNVFQKSFQRENLAYFVDWDEDKLGKIERIARKQQGSGIIYLRSRKGTERLCKALEQRGINADFYHAGVDSKVRSEKQERWMRGDTQIIIATNAFGMGIDKADVRFVIHCDLPDTLENYYQECGRAGRDGEKAYAIAVLAQKDVDAFDEKAKRAFPEKKAIKDVYNGMCSLLNLAIGSGKDETFPVNLELLGDRIGMDVKSLHHCLRILEQEGYIAMKERTFASSTVQVIAHHDAVYELRQKGDRGGEMLDALLRSYPRLFEEETSISEWNLAKRLKITKDMVVEMLGWLSNAGYISYQESSDLPRVTFSCERLAIKNVRLSDEHYRLRKRIVKEKAEAMRDYITSTHKCRSRLILEYFGEIDAPNCKVCDVCKNRAAS